MASVARSAWTHIPAKYPFAFGVGVSCVKTSFSDLLVQKVVERREEIDWRRNMAFAAFGFFYLGGVQYTLYVPVFSRLFPHAAKFAAKPLREKIRDVKGMTQLVGQVSYIRAAVCVPFKTNVCECHIDIHSFINPGISRSMCSSSADVLSSILHDQRTCHGGKAGH
jgi:hypothetical protein